MGAGVKILLGRPMDPVRRLFRYSTRTLGLR
jgi:hypothetical protein